MYFDSPDKLNDAVKDLRDASAPVRWQLARSIGTSQSYYCGAQWIEGWWYGGVPQSTDGTGRLMTNYNPESTSLRATHNLVTKMIIHAAAATHPSQIYVDAYPPDADPGIDSSFVAGVMEMLANAAIDYSQFLLSAQDAQHNRCIAGSWGLGLYLQDGWREYRGEKIKDRCAKAFTFDPVRLILDPGQTSRRLYDHDIVIYEDVWTYDKIRRVFGDSIEQGTSIKDPKRVIFDPEKMQTFGQLLSQEVEIATISNGQLYQHYRTYSRTKGARVTQTYCKGASGRFDAMYTSIQDTSGEFKTVNFENPENPFGGNGMPLALMHAHRRPGSMWSIGEGQMTKEMQDQVNLLRSLFMRQVQAHGGFQWMFDKRSFPKDVSEDSIRNRLSNRVAGMVVYESKQDKSAQAPQLIQYPAPQPFIMDAIGAAEQSMREQVMRAEGHFGAGAKSHVPYATTDRLLEESDQVLGIRVQEDAEVYSGLITTLVATNIKLVKDENPGTLAFLSAQGFGEDEFQVLLEADEYDLGCTIKVRESSVRFRSLQSRQQDLDGALERQAIDPIDYRMEKAGLDVALTANDQQMFSAIRKRVDRLVRGQAWEPMSLGVYNKVALDMLRRAQFDKRVDQNPQLRQMVMEAIMLQTEAGAREQQMAAMASEPTQPAPAPEAEQQPMTLGDVVSQMEGSSGQQGVPAQPVAA